MDLDVYWRDALCLIPDRVMHQRSTPHKIALLAMVVAALCLAWAARWTYHVTNYTGLVVFPSLQVVRVLQDGPAAGSGIQPGDRVVSVDGRPLKVFSEYFRTLKDEALTGKTVELEVDRGGRSLVFPIRMVHYPLVHLSLFGPGCGMLLLAFGIYVFLRCPDQRISDLYLVLTTCLFVLLALSSHILKQASSPLILLLWGTAFLFVVPVNLHFYLLFPEPKPLVREHPRLLLLLYVVPGLFQVWLARSVWLLGASLAGGTDSVGPFLGLRNMFVAYFFVGLMSCAAFVGSLVHSFLTASTPESRRQVQVVLIGALTTFFLAIPVTYALVMFLLEPVPEILWPQWAYPLLYGLIVVTTVILPFSMAVAVLKYRLWDLDTAISRSLIYMGVTVSLIALYFVILGVTSWVLGRVMKPHSQVALLVFTLTVAAVAEPLRHLVKRLVDRTFNRDAHEYGRALRTFTRELVSLHRLEEIGRGLSQTVFKTLGASNAAVVLRGDAGRDAPPVSCAVGFQEEQEQVVLSGKGALAELAGAHRGALVPQELLRRPDLSPGARPWLEALQSLGVCLVVPFGRERQVVGWMALREKKSGVLYSGQDRQLLETMADQAAVAVNNARAFETIEQLNRELREKIGKVQEQQAEILVLQERLLGENRYLKEQIRGSYDFAEIVGAEHGLRGVMEVVERAAGTDATVLISGETGTGKELIARAIHFNSDRKAGPFIGVNCAALAEGVLQSELFGHEKGAFTGAHERRVGRFELAEGGSLFLDEIGEVSPATQVLLLRVLQERAFERVGGSRTLQADVRVIAATNRDLREEVNRGNFRMDLYYRLKVVTLDVPPLRERVEDIFGLVLHFVEKYARKYGKGITRVDEEVMERFKAYRWPGNVREMENVIERSIVLCRGEVLGPGDIPMELRVLDPSAGRAGGEGAARAPAGAPSHRQRVRDLEIENLKRALAEAGGNKSLAARALGLKRSTFFNKLKKYGLLEA